MKPGKILLFFGVLILCGIGPLVFSQQEKIKLLFYPSLPDVKAKGATIAGKLVCKGKQWLHRVDGLQRALLMQEKFEGVEIDVHFDSLNNTFSVYHDSSTRLALETLINSLKNPSEHYYWLDFKNLDSTNQVPALQKISALADKYKLNGRIIVESPKPFLLAPFTKAGFFTSYYLPVFNPYTANGKSIEEYVEEISENLSRSQVNAISGNFVQYPVMKKYFPDCEKLLWHLDESKDIFTKILRRRFLNDPKVRVVLIQELSPGYL